MTMYRHVPEVLVGDQLEVKGGLVLDRTKHVCPRKEHASQINAIANLHLRLLPSSACIPPFV